MVVFNNSTDEKLGKVLEFRNNLLLNYQKKPKKVFGFKNPFEINDFFPAHPTNDEVKKVNHLFSKNMKFGFYYLFYALFGLGYCLVRSYKFSRAKIFTKSLYSWAVFIPTLPLLQKYIDASSSKYLYTEIELIYLNQFFKNELNKFNNEQEKEAFRQLLLNQLDMYKNFSPILTA